MVIRRKADVDAFLDRFTHIASWDGEKYYLLLEDQRNEGEITLMKYPDGSLTMYRKNVSYWDIQELPLDRKEIWKHRKELNKQLGGLPV
jgi:hypothetical protein